MINYTNNKVRIRLCQETICTAGAGGGGGGVKCCCNCGGLIYLKYLKDDKATKCSERTVTKYIKFK